MVHNAVPEVQHVAIEHVFSGIQVGDYVSLFFDDRFNQACAVALRVTVTVVRFDRSDKRIVRHLCYEPERKPGDAVELVYGKRRATFLEELDYDVVTRRGAWRTVPNQWAERVKNEGTLEFVGAGADTKRILNADVKVSAFGFGRLVERAVVSEIQKSYETTATVTRQWIAEGRVAVVGV